MKKHETGNGVRLNGMRSISKGEDAERPRTTFTPLPFGEQIGCGEGLGGE
jgi:hypothetical protein